MNIAAIARRKLRQLEIAGNLEDLRIPPGNRLEALKGDRAGHYSIRINRTEVAERKMGPVLTKIRPWTAVVAQEDDSADRDSHRG